jgi:hypothetical protein
MKILQDKNELNIESWTMILRDFFVVFCSKTWKQHLLSVVLQPISLTKSYAKDAISSI